MSTFLQRVEILTARREEFREVSARLPTLGSHTHSQRERVAGVNYRADGGDDKHFIKVAHERLEQVKVAYEAALGDEDGGAEARFGYLKDEMTDFTVCVEGRPRGTP